MIGGVPWGAQYRVQRRRPNEIDGYVRREFGDPEGTWFLEAVARDRSRQQSRATGRGAQWLARLTRAIVALR